jgi:hypothetical protein
MFLRGVCFYKQIHDFVELIIDFNSAMLLASPDAWGTLLVLTEQGRISFALEAFEHDVARVVNWWVA